MGADRIDHYTAAEHKLELSESLLDGHSGKPDSSTAFLIQIAVAQAQTHATLALFQGMP